MPVAPVRWMVAGRKSRSSSIVYVVDVHLGLYNPPPQVPPGSCRASRRAPHPSRAVFCRSRSTVPSVAPSRSRKTCHRIAASPSRSHRITSSPFRVTGARRGHADTG